MEYKNIKHQITVDAIAEQWVKILLAHIRSKKEQEKISENEEHAKK